MTLKRRRTELSLTDEKKKSILLNEFFDRMITKRNEQIAKSVREIQLLNSDKKRVNVSFWFQFTIHLKVRLLHFLNKKLQY